MIDVGDIVLAAIHNRKVNPMHERKWRPAVVVALDGHRTALLHGLTTVERYEEGGRRCPYDRDRAGLDQSGFLWGGHLVRVDFDEINPEPIGQCYWEMARDVVRNTRGLSRHRAAAFLDAVAQRSLTR